MRKRLGWLTAACTVWLCIACAGTHFEWDKARQIKAGMTESEVTALLGKPYLVTSSDAGVRWVWAYGEFTGASRSVTVFFRDGQVVGAPQIPGSFK